MKKSYVLYTNSSGFLFPYTMFIISILLIMTITSIATYQNHIEMSQMEYELIKIENLTQLAKTELKDDTKENEITQKKYIYPNGTVIVTFKSGQTDTSTYDFLIQTDKNAKSLIVVTI
ncbi:hypothetical protein [Aquibacillus kalidii]|uniref:hypothetical protein n=1 Tax=Aquibacillus kalidii TaxID=2762597 RepID=UPI001645C065|nr:hypothetical protein [Aquibacillus kalidii]